MSDPTLHPDLNGSAPDSSPVALLLIDVIVDFNFPGGDDFLKQAAPIAPRLAELKRRAQAAGIPVVYVNDNFGRWRSDFKTLVQHCLRPESRGHAFTAQLKPDEQDYFVLKPKHSGFYATSLSLLLRYLRARTLIITGMAGNVCVQFTANDAFLRDYRIVVPRDCIASATNEQNTQALAQMESLLDADTSASIDLDLDALLCRDEDYALPH
jgi:nicotinamidase-related amidase